MLGRYTTGPELRIIPHFARIGLGLGCGFRKRLLRPANAPFSAQRYIHSAPIILTLAP